MKIKYLSWFCYIVQCGGLRKASQKLGVAPSTLSRCMERLEADAGQPLYLRDASGFSLTEAGKIYLDYAKRILSIQSIMYQSLPQEKVVSKQVLHVGISTISLKHLMRVFPQLLLECPELQLIPREGKSHTLIQLLRAKEINIAIGSLCELPSNDIKTAFFYKNEVVLAVPDAYLPVGGGNWGEERAVREADAQLFHRLEGIPFLRHTPESSMGQLINRIYEEYGFSPAYEFVSESSLFLDELKKTGQYAYFTFWNQSRIRKNTVYFKFPKPYYVYTTASFRREYELSRADIMLCALLYQNIPPVVAGEPCPNGFTKSIMENYKNSMGGGWKYDAAASAIFSRR